MMQSAYSARLAIRAQQERVDTLANNIANINTIGFKSSSVSFKDALYSAMQNPVGGNNNLQQGNGVLISSINRSFSDGTPVETNVKTDFCISGDGFFTVRDGNGNLEYTRNGNFEVSTQADGNYLVTSQGYYVLDSNLNKIKLPTASTEKLTVNANGALSNGTSAPFATLNIASFSNTEGLEAVSGSCFTPTAASGVAGKAQGFTVRQGYLESSNVDLSTEMTKLIRAQRAFSLAGRALTTADDMDGTANNLRT